MGRFVLWRSKDLRTHDDDSDLLFARLDTLKVGSLYCRGPHTDHSFSWYIGLLITNSSSIQHLQLRRDAALAMAVEHGLARYSSDDKITAATVVLQSIYQSLAKHGGPTSDYVFPKLESLELSGLALAVVFDERQFCNLTNLNELVLESCSFDQAAFSALRKHSSELRLRSFTVRQEVHWQQFMEDLTISLCSIPGLQTLHVLLDGIQVPQYLTKILTTHGPTLRSLI